MVTHLLTTCSLITPFLTVVMEMEASGKWPDSPGAIDNIKTAFYLSISSSLRKQYGLVTGTSKDYIDVLKVLINLHVSPI